MWSFPAKFWQKKRQNFFLYMTSGSLLKQALWASRDVIISSQICVSKLQRFFKLGDGCWLPKTPQTVTLQVKIERGQKAIKNQHIVPDHILAYPLCRNQFSLAVLPFAVFLFCPISGVVSRDSAAIRIRIRVAR